MHPDRTAPDTHHQLPHLEAEKTRLCSPAPPRACCVTLGKAPHLSVPHFSTEEKWQQSRKVRGSTDGNHAHGVPGRMPDLGTSRSQRRRRPGPRPRGGPWEVVGTPAGPLRLQGALLPRVESRGHATPPGSGTPGGQALLCCPRPPGRRA